MNFTNLSMVKGDTLAFAIEIEGVNDLENAFFSCKANKGDDKYIFQKSLGNGIYKIDNGKYGVRVAPEDTEGIDAGLYYYDMQIQVNMDIFTVLIGRLEVVQGITTEGY